MGKIDKFSTLWSLLQMTRQTLQARLTRKFGEANPMSRQRGTPDVLDICLRQHSVWLRSNGRFGLRMRLPYLSDRRRNQTFTGINMDAFDFSKAKLANVTFLWCNLRLASFAGAEFRGVRFEGCDMEGADFAGAVFNNVVFEECPDLNQSSFEGVLYKNSRNYGQQTEPNSLLT